MDTILITGGTSGIGRALAERFHARGHRVIVGGRRREELRTLSQACPGLETLELDVSDPDRVDRFAAEIARRFPELNVLINNAGISRAEDLADPAGTFATARAIVETNILGVLQLTAALLPTLLARPKASVITTTSGLAFVPRANFPTYCASKAFLHSWIQSLRTQMRGTGVEVLELAPPYVRTALAGPGQLEDPAAMPLDAYIDEVMTLLDGPRPPSGEILVERVKALRFAERQGGYDAVYNTLNAG